MALGKIIFWTIILYMLYKFVFNVVVPVSKTAKDVKSKIKEMQEQQQQFFTAQQQQTEQHQQQAKNATSTAVDKGDYIDFEEVK